MALILQTRGNDGKPRYYQHYDGKKPIFGPKSSAARMTEDICNQVERHLSLLGFSGIKRMDENSRPE